MDEALTQEVARQLRKPEGDGGREIGIRMNEGNARMNRHAIRMLNIQPGDRILEIGMGNGAFAAEICAAAPDVRYEGCDYSETMVEEAEGKNAAILGIGPGQASFTLGDAAALPFPDEWFDAVLAVNTIYFWEPAKELQSILDVLRPGGKLVLGIRPDWCMDTLPFTAWGFTKYSSSSIRETLEAAGFRVTGIEEYKADDNAVTDAAPPMAHMIITAVPAV